MTTSPAQNQTTTIHPKKVIIETGNSSNSNLNDPFLNENTTTNSPHLNSDFMPHDTQNQFQKHLDELDHDLSKFDLPAKDSINQKIPPIIKSSPNHSLPFSTSTHPKIFSQLPTLSPSPTTSPTHPYHIPEPTLPP